ncbi:MAG TPA: transposase [Patescibacteria group bacterium]|nr:transposase [Patescibacteria group bacterium]
MPKGKALVSKEVKEQVLKRIRDEGQPVAQVAAEHGLHVKTIYSWLNKQITGQPSILEVAKLKRENQALKQLIGQIMLDLELEKKKTDDRNGR